MRPPTRILGVVLAGILVIPAGVASAQVAPAPAEAGLGIRLAEAPTSGRNDPRARSAVVDHVAPGARFTRRIAVRNGTSSPITTDTYVAAARITDDEFVIDGRGATGPLTRWARVEPASLALAPGQIAEVQLVVDVPAGARDGEYYGAAVASVSARSAGGVTAENRVGVRIYLSVGAGAAPESDFSVTGLRASRPADGRPVVTAAVRNTGGRALDMSGTLRLSHGPAGLSAGPFPAELGRTLPIGGRGGVRVVLDRATPAGPWKAALTLRSGTVEHTVAGTITFPRPGQAPVGVRVHRVDRQKGPAAVVALLLLLGVVAGLLLWWLARRRHDGDEGDVGGAHGGVRAGAG